MVRMATGHQDKKSKSVNCHNCYNSYMRMPMTEQEKTKLTTLMQTKVLNAKKVMPRATREVKLRTIPGSVRSATLAARLQVIFANQRNVSYS